MLPRRTGTEHLIRPPSVSNILQKKKYNHFHSNCPNWSACVLQILPQLLTQEKLKKDNTQEKNNNSDDDGKSQRFAEHLQTTRSCEAVQFTARSGSNLTAV